MSSDSVDQDLKEAGDSFMSHLIELRSRLVKASVSFFVVFLCLVYFASDIYDLLARPMMAALPEGTHMIATGVTTPFLVPMKVTAMVAFVIALPMILYQAWAFIAPGLYTHEKRLALRGSQPAGRPESANLVAESEHAGRRSHRGRAAGCKPANQ